MEQQLAEILGLEPSEIKSWARVEDSDRIQVFLHDSTTRTVTGEQLAKYAASLDVIPEYPGVGGDRDLYTLDNKWMDMTYIDGAPRDGA